MALHEEQREDIPYAVIAEEEEKTGTFFMSSKDMCMIEHIPELEESGISSYKIEGRVKSAYYTAVVTNAYRLALDAYRNDPARYVYDPAWMHELNSVSHREFGTGFYFKKPFEDANTVTVHGYMKDRAYLATAVTDSERQENGLFDTLFVQRNKLFAGDEVELLAPGHTGLPFKADRLFGRNGDIIDSTPHPSMFCRLQTDFPVRAGDILRQK